jgi:predicted Zn-dependent protease
MLHRNPPWGAWWNLGKNRIVMRFFCAALLAGFAALALPFDGQERLLPKMLKDLNTARTAADSGDYAKAEALVQLVRCPDIKVELPAGATTEQKEALIEAAAIWENALHGAVDFQIVEPGQGQVRVGFKKDVFFAGVASMGRATWNRQLVNFGWGNYGTHISASIEVRTQLFGKECRKEEIRHALAHELGHVLGLDDSSKLGDIMGPHNPERPATAPSYEEAAALSELHWEAYQIEMVAKLAQPGK